MKVYIILVPGTWETGEADKPQSPTGMTKQVADHIGAKVGEVEFSFLSVPYTAGYGDKSSYLNSVNNGKANTRTILAVIPTGAPIFLVGYSQGGTIAGDIMRDWGNNLGENWFNKLNILAYYGLADPRRNHGDIVGPDPGGCGITGERGGSGRAQDRTYQFCAPGDIIASSNPATDLFQEIGKFTNKFWVNDPVAWIGYCLGVLRDPAFLRNIQAEYKGLTGWFKFQSKLKKTIGLGVSYMQTGVHGSYGAYKLASGGPTAVQWIAGDIKNKAAKELSRVH